MFNRSGKDDDGMSFLISKGYTEYNTVYIEGSNVLDFSVFNNAGYTLIVKIHI